MAKPRIRKYYPTYDAREEGEVMLALGSHWRGPKLWLVWQSEDDLFWLMGSSQGVVDAYIITDREGNSLSIDSLWIGGGRKTGPDILHQDEWKLTYDEDMSEEATAKGQALSQMTTLALMIAKLADDPDLPEYDDRGNCIKDALLKRRNQWLRSQREDLVAEHNLDVEPTYEHDTFEQLFQSAAWTFQEEYEQSFVSQLARDLGIDFDSAAEWIREHYRRPDYDYQAEMEQWA